MADDIGRRLTARNAIVSTAMIQLATLTLDRKQVTLAVFRQLIEEQIFDWQTLALRGAG